MAGDFDAYESGLLAYAEVIAEALAAPLDPGELAELVRIDDEAALELNRLKDDLRTRLTGLARRSQASSAYLSGPATPPADARSA